MKQFVVLFSLWLVLATGLRADGYPFNPETQKVNVDHLRLQLAPAQMSAVTATGMVILQEPQLLLVRRFYPNAKARQSVLSATFNDNVEELTEYDVHLFWVAAGEIAITLNHRVLSDQARRKKALASEINSSYGDIRLSPEGSFYADGKAVTKEDLIEIVSRIAQRPLENDRHLQICVSPPYHLNPWDYARLTDGSQLPVEELEKRAADALVWIVQESKKRKVLISRTW